MEQPRVLDGDDGLSGKILDQLDLLLGERANLVAIEDNGADQSLLLEHRHAQDCPHTTTLDSGNNDWITFQITARRRQVDDLNGLLGARNARNDSFRSWPPISLLLQIFSICWHRTMYCNNFPGSAVISIHEPEFGLTNFHSVSQHCLKDRLQLAGRRTNDSQDLRGRRLLLQRLTEIARALAQLVEQPRVLDGNDSLRGEIADKFDLLSGERTDLLAVNDNCADKLLLLDRWHSERGSGAGKLGKLRAGRDGPGVGAVRFLSKVGDLDGPLRSQGTSEERR